MTSQLEKLLSQKAKLDAEVAQAQEEAAQREAERKAAEARAQEEKRKAEKDAVVFGQTKELADRIIEALGKHVQDPAAPFVVSILLYRSPDPRDGRLTVDAGLCAIKDYFQWVDSKH